MHKSNNQVEDLIKQIQILAEGVEPSLTEEQKNNKEFIEKRKAGAAKIAKQAAAKGGYSNLTAAHFKAKEKPYSTCIKDFKTPKSIDKRVNELIHELKDWHTMTQTEFQQVMGELEAYGEVAIQLRTPKTY
jgi:hypothetical protein